MSLRKMIYEHIYKCPYCGYAASTMFPIKHYEGGSSGYRTFKCPNCDNEIEE